MKKIFLMNSAMMPTDGVYTCKTISATQFKNIFLYAKTHEGIVSSVAYPEIQDVVGKNLDIVIPIDRAKGLTVLDEYSNILVVKLKYRVPSERKGHRLGSKFDDYEFKFITKKPPSHDSI